jgi:hypothetical protein
MQQPSNAMPNTPQQPQAPPAPTHAQTVAALRHFSAIGKQLQSAMQDPDLGKTDIKNKIIDGVTALVADRIIPPTAAVTELSTFPERPYDQKIWVQQHLMQVMQARNAVLAHHAAAFAGGAPQPTPSADDHMSDLQAMQQSHYSGQQQS